jgi:4-carboxymuconolactone decarboxylase
MTPAPYGRLRWLAPDELDDAQRAVYDHVTAGARADRPPPFALTDPAGRLEGPFNAMLINPQIGDRVERLGAALRFRGALSERCREIAILTVAVRRSSDFEWYAHELIGRQCGLSSDELAAVWRGRDADTFSVAERLVWRSTISLCEAGDLDDELFTAAREALGTAVLDELVVLVGYYQLLALSLRVWRTPLPDGVAAVFETD